jgi:hypothetical protein
MGVHVILIWAAMLDGSIKNKKDNKRAYRISQAGNILFRITVFYRDYKIST